MSNPKPWCRSATARRTAAFLNRNKAPARANGVARIEHLARAFSPPPLARRGLGGGVNALIAKLRGWRFDCVWPLPLTPSPQAGPGRMVLILIALFCALVPLGCRVPGYGTGGTGEWVVP